MGLIATDYKITSAGSYLLLQCMYVCMYVLGCTVCMSILIITICAIYRHFPTLKASVISSINEIAGEVKLLCVCMYCMYE